MTPVTPDQTPPDWSNVAAEVATWLGRVAASVAGLYASLHVIYKPLQEYRKTYRERQATALAANVRSIIAPEIDRMNALADREETCLEGNERVLKLQRAIFEDVSSFLEISRDNRDRHDEMSELMDQVFGLDRRVDLEKRKRIDNLMTALRDRHQQRRTDAGA